MNLPSSDTIVKRIDLLVKPLVWVSIVAFLIETHLKTENSLEGPMFFLWLERGIAFIFTIEWAIRFHRNRAGYRRSMWNGIDLIAIVPFWVGFPISWFWPQYLHLIRTLRIFRLLKFFRYSRSLQLVALGFYRAWPQVKSLLFSVMIIGLFSMVTMYEAERRAQPEEFDSLFNSLWFTAVTATTVGYGDISPVTTIGKCVAMTTFVFTLSLFAAIVGVLGNSFSAVIEEEIDPDIDPIQKFRDTFEQPKSPIYFHVVTRCHPNLSLARWHVCLRTCNYDVEELLTRDGFETQSEAIKVAKDWRTASKLNKMGVPIITNEGDEDIILSD